jgi:hypothetical protein
MNGYLVFIVELGPCSNLLAGRWKGNVGAEYQYHNMNPAKNSSLLKHNER